MQLSRLKPMAVFAAVVKTGILAEQGRYSGLAGPQ